MHLEAMCSEWWVPLCLKMWFIVWKIIRQLSTLTQGHNAQRPTEAVLTTHTQAHTHTDVQVAQAWLLANLWSGPCQPLPSTQPVLTLVWNKILTAALVYYSLSLALPPEFNWVELVQKQESQGLGATHQVQLNFRTTQNERGRETVATIFTTIGVDARKVWIPTQKSCTFF